MRFSLRTLLMALGVLPLIVGFAVWTLFPERGTPQTISEFERALASGSKSRIESAAYYCFVEGVPTKRYESLLAKAITVHTGRSFIYFPATATVYELPSGESPEEGKCCVLVAVDGQPPKIMSAIVSGYTD